MPRDCAGSALLLTSKSADPLVGPRARWGGEAAEELGGLPSEGPARDGTHEPASSSDGATSCRERSSSRPRHSCSICHLIAEIYGKSKKDERCCHLRAQSPLETTHCIPLAGCDVFFFFFFRSRQTSSHSEPLPERKACGRRGWSRSSCPAARRATGSGAAAGRSRRPTGASGDV